MITTYPKWVQHLWKRWNTYGTTIGQFIVQLEISNFKSIICIYHLIFAKIAIIKISKQHELVRMWRKGNPFALLVGMQIGAATVESSREIPQKLKMDLPLDLAIPLLGICPKEPQVLIWKNINTSMFIAALFTITKIWKQPKCPSIDEWIKQLWGICTMEYLLSG